MNRIAKVTGTALVGAALLAPAAWADRPDDLAGARGPGAIAAQNAPVRPDDRAGPRGPGAFADVILVDRGESSIDWRDATIGGIAGVGCALLVTGGGVLVLTQRKRPRPA
ncbi:MAG TPA: hypothetical protein VFI83_03490 [Gaiella sp.]|nr:hypothetical protein [Gaiella sp.]